MHPACVVLGGRTSPLSSRLRFPQGKGKFIGVFSYDAVRELEEAVRLREACNCAVLWEAPAPGVAYCLLRGVLQPDCRVCARRRNAPSAACAAC